MLAIKNSFFSQCRFLFGLPGEKKGIGENLPFNGGTYKYWRDDPWACFYALPGTPFKKRPPYYVPRIEKN